MGMADPGTTLPLPADAPISLSSDEWPSMQEVPYWAKGVRAGVGFRLIQDSAIFHVASGKLPAAYRYIASGKRK